MNTLKHLTHGLAVVALIGASMQARSAELAVYRFNNTLASGDTEPDSVASDFVPFLRPPINTGAQRFSGGAVRIGQVYVSSSSDDPAGAAKTKGLFSAFTITPDAGQVLNLSSLDFKIATNSFMSPRQLSYAVYSSADNYTDALLAPTLAAYALADAPTIDLSGASFQGLTGPVSFRIYHWLTNDQAIVIGGTIDDVVLQGSLAPVPEPATGALLLAGIVALGAWRRHKPRA